MSDATFHGLLIGVDHYFDNVLPNQARFHSLHGCVRDVSRVEAVLRARLPDRQLSITRLLAPNEGGDRPGGDESAWPTATNIRKALAELAERARPGDQVFIFYSGHGGREITAWKKLKGGDGIDEALVPTDIGVPLAPGRPPFTRPERYIRDVELALYLDRLAQRVDPRTGARIVVTVVLDCCHSGGMPRGTEIAVRSATGGTPTADDPRGTLDRQVLPPGALPDLRAMEEAFERLRATAEPEALAEVSWLPPAKGYVLLAACRDVESALEASLDGRPRAGVLTDAFIEALGTLGTDQTWKTLYDRILARVRGRFPSQTPQLLGEIGRHVLGVELWPVVHTFSVKAVDLEQHRVTIDAGFASMITRGAELGIYRPGETQLSTARRVAVAEIIDVDDFAVVASFAPAAASVEVGAPAVIQRLALRRRVELFRRSDLPPALASRQDEALAAVAAAISTQGKGFLEVCGPGETPHYQVALAEQGHYEICDPRGAPYQYLEPVSAVGSPDAPSSVVAKLGKLAKCHGLLELRAPESTLPEQVRVDLLAAPSGWDSRSGQPPSPVGGTLLERTGDCYSVASGTWIWVRIKNKQPSQPVNVALFGIDRKWDITMDVPSRHEIEGKKYETISDQAGTFAIQMYTPIPEAFDDFQLFMTLGDVDFRWLDPEARPAAERSAARRRPVDESMLGLVLEAFGRGEGRTRQLARARATSTQWSVQRFRIRTFS